MVKGGCSNGSIPSLTSSKNNRLKHEEIPLPILLITIALQEFSLVSTKDSAILELLFLFFSIYFTTQVMKIEKKNRSKFLDQHMKL